MLSNRLPLPPQLCPKPRVNVGPRRWLFRAAIATLISLGGMEGSVAATQNTVSQPFAGVTYTHRQVSGERLQNIHIVQIDLTQPGLKFQVTSPNLDGTTPLQTTLDYASTTGAKIGINGNFFLPSPAQEGKVQGLAASKGSVYGSWTNGALAGVNISAENTLTYVAPAKVPGTSTSPKLTPYNLVSGFALITQGKVRLDILDGTEPAARSAIGLNQAGTELVLLVVDGPASGVSSGMTQVAVANLLLKEFNLFNAINLDGGGSSTLVFCKPLCKFANVPSSRSLGIGDRVVGNNLGILIPDPKPTPKATPKPTSIPTATNPLPAVSKPPAFNLRVVLSIIFLGILLVGIGQFWRYRRAKSRSDRRPRK
jgi:exopolysaccharide biosynthesis protein